MLRFALASTIVTLAACSSAPSGPELLSWQLADGRDCFSSGVTAVEVRATRSLATQPLAAARCSDGLEPAVFTVTDAPGSGTLYLDGVDPLGTDLYHGELSLDSYPPGTGETRLVTLYAAAAE